MKQKTIFPPTPTIILIIIIGFFTFPLNAQKVTKLCEKGQYEKAEQYCAKQKSEVQKQTYLELAEAYFNINNYEKAATFYENASNK